MTNGSLKLGEESEDEEDLTKYITTAGYQKNKVPVDKSLDSELSFTLLYQKIRRKYMINAITSKDEKKVRGYRILKNVEKQLASTKKSKTNEFDFEDDLGDA
uniref:Uncharacterized protein n=1 Tax=Euplotes harpa TaxID=151035 RepID=A0A7S3N8Y4_9SPIT|mmetsp:Transcript_35094/g.40558  ORF Transcript_35094/g.40558 Transcript_35094/m.40558 type:complete len:102 (+) Transcript_35094:208-513(+)